MLKILRWLVAQMYFQMAEAAGGIAPAEARTFLADFVPDPAALSAMPDPDVLAYHGRVTAGMAKHAPKPPGAPDPNKPWYEGFKDQPTKDWLTAYKGAYPDAEAVALKALNLEKFIGAEKSGRGVIAPKPDAKPEEWQAFYKKIGGVPEKPDGYTLPEALAKDPMAVKFRDFAHQAAMPPVFFDAAMKFIATEGGAAAQSQLDDFDKRAEADMVDLRNEWKGLKYDENVELGRRAAKAFIPHKDAADLETTMTRIEGAIGTKMTMKLWAAIGGAIGEHTFVNAEGQGVNTGGLTPEAARLRVAELQRDPEWSKRFVAGGADEKMEWEKLHKVMAIAQQQ